MKERVFINSDNIATFICPECQKVRHANVAKIVGINKALSIKCQCKCGNKFEAILERRKFFRENIELDGIVFMDSDDQKFSVIVTDISRAGLKLKLKTNHDLSFGDELLIEFNLDNTEKTLISKKIIVRSLSGLDLGVEFKSSEHYDKFGSYLMFK